MTFQLANTTFSTSSAYNQAQTQASEAAIIASYNDLFTAINTAAAAGQTKLTYVLNQVADYKPIVNLLNKYGYNATLITVLFKGYIGDQTVTANFDLTTLNSGNILTIASSISNVSLLDTGFVLLGSGVPTGTILQTGISLNWTLNNSGLINQLTAFSCYTLKVDWSTPNSVAIVSPITGFNVNLINTTVGVYTYVEIKPIGGKAPYTFTNVNGTTIPGLTIDTTNTNYIIVSGTPTTAELAVAVLSIRVSDSTWPVSQTFTVDIDLNIAPQASITSTNITSFTAATGIPVSVSVRPTGGIAPYSFNIAGILPAGLTSSSGTTALVISGTPTTPQVGYGALLLTITDSKGYTFTQDLSYTITGLPYNPNPPAVVSKITGFNITNFTGTTGILLTVVLKPIGGVAPFTFSFSGSIPHNCVYTATTNSFTINGAPDTPTVQLNTFTITAVDSNSNSFSQDITYTIVQGPVVNFAAGTGTSYISAIGIMMP